MIFLDSNRGFTLVEMMVSVGIFTVMSAIVLANYPEFRSRNAIDNLVAQVATVFKEAQIYGISVREEGSSNFNVGYGVHIDTNVSDKDILVFTDKNNNRTYDGSTTDTLLETFRLTGGEYISTLCAPGCPPATGGGEYDSITTTFVRPNPDAYFALNGTVTNFPSVLIEISNPSGSYKRSIQIFSTGQISIK